MGWRNGSRASFPPRRGSVPICRRDLWRSLPGRERSLPTRATRSVRAPVSTARAPGGYPTPGSITTGAGAETLRGVSGSREAVRRRSGVCKKSDLGPEFLYKRYLPGGGLSGRSTLPYLRQACLPLGYPRAVKERGLLTFRYLYVNIGLWASSAATMKTLVPSQYGTRFGAARLRSQRPWGYSPGYGQD